MTENKELKCCFIGHRTVADKDKTAARLKAEIRNIIVEYNVRTFLFGSKSEFNDICHEAVTEIKDDYPDIKRILYACKSEAACLESERERTSRFFSKLLNKPIQLQGYEEEYKSSEFLSSGRASYVERNKAMIRDSEICIFYFCKDYRPRSGGNSGTRIAYDYADNLSKKQNGNPKIINIYDESD